MTFTYDSTDLSTALAQVRRLIHDTVAATALFTDEEIAWFLEEQGEDVYHAAAMALDAVANDQSKLGIMLKIGNYQSDTRGLAKDLRDQAQGLREMSPYVEASELAVTDFNTATIIHNKWKREA